MRTLQEAGPITLVLDECHHLLEVWGRLLGELLRAAARRHRAGADRHPGHHPDPDQAVLVDQLFGDVVYSASIPAVVREGHLAPFADLIWLTTPSATEAQWLADQNQRFAELTTQLLDPSFGSVPFLTWVDRRFAGEVRFDRIAAKQPLLADAALRMQYAGLLRLADDVPMGEQHRHAPTADDWALLIDDWYDACLVSSVDDRDQDVREALRRSLPAVGYQLTKRGMRKGRSSVDRVLARSESKSRAMVEIISAEHRNLGDRLAMLVICDHEAAAATVGIDLKGVLDRAGGICPAGSCLAPGRPDHGCPGAGHGHRQDRGRRSGRARATAGRTDVELVVGEPDGDGISELVGPSGAWTSREWVRAVTDFFTTGDAKVLIGTRALLGEGWDAPTASGLIDLSMASTSGTVVQTRGRTLRLDPRDEAKVAVNWTVCCVAEDHPKGDNDWQRTVTKHRGYFGVDQSGDIVDGVAHIHPAFSPYEPPPADTSTPATPRCWCEPSAGRTSPPPGRSGCPTRTRCGSRCGCSRAAIGCRRSSRGGPLPSAARRWCSPQTGYAVAAAPAPRSACSRCWPSRRLALMLAEARCPTGRGWWERWPLWAEPLWWSTPRRTRLGAGRAAHRARRRPARVRACRRPAPGRPDQLRCRGGRVARGRRRTPADPARLAFEERDSAVFAEALAELLAPIAQPRYLVPRYLVGEPGRST